jgi:hypothetical protein
MSNHSRISQSISDAYFTSRTSAEFCRSILTERQWATPNSTTLEPCCGNGSLIENLPGKILYSDLHDYGIGATVENYLEAPPKGTDLIFTNPPFGRAGSLALQFLKKAASECNRLAFILPSSFRKISLLDRVPTTHSLIADYQLPDQSYLLPDGSTRVVQTTFQLWEKGSTPRPKLGKIAPYRSYTKRVPIDEAEFAFRTQGASAGRILTGLNYNPASTAFLSGGQQRFRKHDWTPIAKHTAGIPAIGLNDVALGLHLEDNRTNITPYLTQGAPYVLTNLATLPL